MAQKRPFDEMVSEVSSKHRRQNGPAAEIIISHGDRFSKEPNIVKFHDSCETDIENGQVDCHDKCEETENDAPRSALFSHWASSGTSDEDDPPEEIGHFPFYSGYFSFDRPVKPPVNHPDDISHCLFDYPPRKHVPIGIEHQAEIPPWGENTSTGNSDVNGVNLNEMCIIRNLETPSLHRFDCHCEDKGSVRCVRLHVTEARDNLRSVLGEDTFTELGFNDMGEVVADKWTNEEEQLFVKVVYTNPVSLGKNFWNALSAVFPSRSKMEIVSYYFNVFMLRKRAEQNRCDQMSIDSDDDEWEGSDSDDDDSGIESPTRHNGLVCHKELLLHRHEEDDGDVSDDAHETDVKNSQGHVHNFSKKKSDNGGDNDAQDGSCTSSDSGASSGQGTRIKSDVSQHWHEYILDGYTSYPKINVDFLPTCSMIEEVFGGDIDSKETRW